MRTKYTNEDIEFLKIYYPIGDWDAIFTRFPNADKDKIYNVCNKRGISANYYERDKASKSEYYQQMAKNRSRWTADEIEILQKNYSAISIEELMKILPGRTYNSIVEKAKKLSLKSYNRQKQLYSESDINFIKTNWELMSDAEMAVALNRTSRAIKTARNNLGLFRQDIEKRRYEDLTKFFRGQINQWKKDSLQKCNYQCVLTGDKNFDIHHIVSFNVIMSEFITRYDMTLKDCFEDYSLEELNTLAEVFVKHHNEYPLGVCIDKNLHKTFHKMYGYINNEEQWNTFVEKFNEGKILH